MQAEPPVLPAGFDFPTCDQRVAFTGEFVQGRQALGRQLVGMPEAAVALLRSCHGDTFLANQFWAFHEQGARVADWVAVRKAVFRAKPRVPAWYAVKILTLRLEARAA